MKICFAASEVAPLSKTGGLADVAAALPRQLSFMGHDVRVFMPFYSLVERQGREFRPLRCAREFSVDLGSIAYEVSVWTTHTVPGGPPIHLVDCPELYHRSAIYTDEADEPQRFALFSKAVIEICRRMEWSPDLFQCNDWHTGLLPLFLESSPERNKLFRDSATLLTIHNIGYQGIFPGDCLEEIGLDGSEHLLDQEELLAGRIGFLRSGIAHADAITTVSPTYAEEIQGEEYGMGLQALLRQRKESLTGILNGVDYDEWSPERDNWIPYRFSRTRMDGKEKNKSYLLEKLQLSGGTEAPLLGIVSRFARQKGFELCYSVLPELMTGSDLILVALGTGDSEYEEFFRNLEQRFPGRAFYHCGYSDELAHLIEASADMFLMPSRYEPCGLNQMFSLKYGTVPIVRKTGGLADSVTPFKRETADGTGFVFEHLNSDGLRWALRLALETYSDRPLWRQLMSNGMLQDFSWKKQARLYEELFTSVILKRS
jgi:starch synthase